MYGHRECMYGHDSRTGPSPFSEGSRGNGLSRLDPRPPLLSTTATTALRRFVTRLSLSHTHTRHTHLGCSPLSPQSTPRSGMGSYACVGCVMYFFGHNSSLQNSDCSGFMSRVRESGPVWVWWIASFSQSRGWSCFINYKVEDVAM